MSGLDAFRGIGLDAVIAAADLQTRVDTKYLLAPEQYRRFRDALAATGTWACLDIDGRRRFAYESVYFDTPDLLTYRQHRQGRRRRFKVRTRTYVDSGDCAFEVKLKGARQDTVKERLPYRAADAGRIAPDAAEHLARTLWEAYGMAVPAGMAPRLRTDYRRHTLVNLAEDTRVTCDEDLRCVASEATVASRPMHLVEVKAARPGGTADRILWAMGARPESISKYCLAVSVLSPGVRANPWARARRECFGPNLALI
ncbi:polyphosphate polymerase domain-containing protein [Glycomyces buryatensis]|uniref:Polyphosphate polymerase domain-containing protein n=1 Tax=Glycomyces buryatensis TaxID=2570927 RepID=A0A4S8QGQ5_9ACTN|nr:polyphosphate polymerase domain-containing protein [Glycomyces buryatensis]THV42901.1 polyphosphate polymerase domain-containing protein [Glycomyces buryatensis]